MPQVVSSRPSVATVQRYVVDPIDLFGYALLWSCAAVCVTTGAFEFFLTIVVRILPHFTRLWAMSFPTTVQGFLATPLGLLLCGTVFFCWANVYTVKQTRRAYHLLRAWAVSIKISLPLFTVVFQSLTVLSHHQDRRVSSPGVRVLDADCEKPAVVMTVLVEERSCVAGSRVPTMKNTLLRDARRSRLWTQQELADFAAVSLSTVERAERGEQIRVDSIRRLCACLEQSPEQLGLRIKPTKQERLALVETQRLRDE